MSAYSASPGDRPDQETPRRSESRGGVGGGGGGKRHTRTMREGKVIRTQGSIANQELADCADRDDSGPTPRARRTTRNP